MQAIFFTLLVVALPIAVFSKENHCRDQEFAAFKERFEKSYKDGDEEIFRCEIFSANLALIEEHNSRYDGVVIMHKMAINKFADLTTEEFAELHTGVLPPRAHQRVKRAGRSPLIVPNNWVPGNVDLKTSAIPVKEQLGCGSDWAFGAVGIYEYWLYKSYKKYWKLSEQMIVDCARQDGCNGGWPHEGLNYILSHGINFNSVYPYTSKDQPCVYKSTSNPLNGLAANYSREWYTVAADERVLAYTVQQKGWVAAAINADPLMFYDSGIVRAAQCSKGPNQVVIIVGFGHDAATGLDYWIARNTWGASWGEGGYFRLERGKNACDIVNPYNYYRVHLM